MNWHYIQNGQSTGPVSDEQLKELVNAGKIGAGTLVWHEGLAEWSPYSKLNPGMPATAAAGDVAACGECGKYFPVDEMIRHGALYICAGCKPLFMQKLSEGAKINSGELDYAGFWIRVGAKLVDGLILGVPMTVIIILIMVPQVRSHKLVPGASASTFPWAIQLAQIGYIVLNIAYQIFFLGKYGATPGKMICQLKVITAEGGPISYGRATGRCFAEMLSGMICYIGYLMVAFDAQKRGLHDHLCNTRVIYK